ncbi:hypothetical protein P4S68_10075 [Pseudoalteromonas sp. Hal099]
MILFTVAYSSAVVPVEVVLAGKDPICCCKMLLRPFCKSIFLYGVNAAEWAFILVELVIVEFTGSAVFSAFY